MQIRYDEKLQVYRDCKFCGGSGCLACPGEAKKDYDLQFPDGPVPSAVFKVGKDGKIDGLKEFLDNVTRNPPGRTYDPDELSRLIERTVESMKIGLPEVD